MQTLYFLRHAKSSWDFPELSDFERPLNKRGRTDLPLMGKVLKDLGVQPDIILASPANRAATTAMTISEFIRKKGTQIRFESEIYEADPSGLITLLKNTASEIKSLLLVGHNPSLTTLANLLGDKPVSNIPTCGCYALEFKFAAWSDLSEKSGHFLFFEYPKKNYDR